ARAESTRPPRLDERTRAIVSRNSTRAPPSRAATQKAAANPAPEVTTSSGRSRSARPTERRGFARLRWSASSGGSTRTVSPRSTSSCAARPGAVTQTRRCGANAPATARSRSRCPPRDATRWTRPPVIPGARRAANGAPSRGAHGVHARLARPPARGTPRARQGREGGMAPVEPRGTPDVLAHRPPEERLPAPRAVLVAHDHRRVVDDLPARAPQPDAEVDVLEVEAVALVEA